MRGTSLALGIVWVVTTACSESGIEILPPTALAEASSVLLIVEPKDQRPLELYAHEAPLNRRALAFDLDRPLLHTLSILYLDDSLSVLGLEEGSVLAPEGSNRGLPAYLAAYSSELDEDGSSEWTPLGGLSARAQELRLPPLITEADCSSFSATKILLSGVVRIATPLDDSAALVATDDGAFFRVSAAGAEPLTSLTSSVPHGGGAADGTGVIWTFDDTGQLARIDRDLQTTISTVASAPTSRIYGTDAFASPLQLVSATHDGEVVMLKDGAWTRLHTGGTRKAEAAMIGRDELLVVGRDRTLHRYRSITSQIEHTTEELPVDSGKISTVGHLPGVGSFVATLYGDELSRLYAEDPASHGWKLAAEIRLAALTGILDIQPFDDGLLVGGGGGWIAQYIHGRGFCDGFVIGSPLPGGPVWGWNIVVPVGDSFLLVGYELAEGGYTGRGVAWLERMR